MKRIPIFLTLISSVITLQAADVKENYKKYCVVCHDIDGSGNTKLGQKLGVKDFRTKVQDDIKAFEAIKNGLKKDDRVLMKPYSDKLTDDEIKLLVSYIKTFKK